ncbi:MAG: hypothetical protein ACLPPV_10655, partial [Candidatus Korobacteraceae bacterium]
PPRLLRVTLESIHHRQCPLLHLAVNVAGFAAEKESLIRVSLDEFPQSIAPAAIAAVRCFFDELLYKR